MDDLSGAREPLQRTRSDSQAQAEELVVIRSENVLMTCDVCDNPELAYVTRHLFISGAQRARYYCEAHCPEQFIADREQRDHRYTTGYLLAA
jgi:hypothetical protein